MPPFHRIAPLLLHLLHGLLSSSLVYRWVDAPRRERLVRQWSRRILSLCGVRCGSDDRRPSGPPGRALLVSNHTSWLDILVINAYRPCRFVAKSEIRRWPLIGWLCDMNGTIFISPEKRREIREVHRGLIAGLRSGERVGFFPEGGTSDQGTVLPFHANLFEAAIEAGVPIQPCAVRYTDSRGRLHPGSSFTGTTTFGQSVSSILKSRDMRAELLLLPAIETAGLHRRDVAVAARSAIAEALGAVLMATAKA